KTLALRTLASAIKTGFRRIQFTPDMLPADIIGTEIYNPKDVSFVVKHGPVFSNLVLADEINRAPAKTQSALLQAMMEAEVSIDGKTHELSDFFMVCATQNPIEMEGTYPLPEAQLDRFLFQINVGYPNEADEVRILESHHISLRTDDLANFDLQKIAGKDELLAARQSISAVLVRREVLEYVTTIIRRTREHPSLTLGASPRGGLMALVGAKAWAARDGRDFVLPDDIKKIMPFALRHRLQLHPGAQIEGATVVNIIDEILAQTEVPR
ncbi:MAG: MoxR family ATPase, partial [Planctomycetes bacterium]|nr:MoxR family ATPase [Planctomycetota bacterium]